MELPVNEVKEAKRLDFEKVEEEEVGEGRRWSGKHFSGQAVGVGDTF